MTDYLRDLTSDIAEDWIVAAERWRPGIDDHLLCVACQRSPYLTSSQVHDLAPHALTHQLVVSLSTAERRLAEALEEHCPHPVHTDAPDDRDTCAHVADARVLLVEDLAGKAPDLVWIVENVVEPRRRAARDSTSRFLTLRFEEWLRWARDWRPSMDGIMTVVCDLCFTHTLRGDPVIASLPHDLRHSLYLLIGELVDEVEVEEEVRCALCAAGRPAWRCRHADSARSAVYKVFRASELAFATLLRDVVHPRRRRWVMDTVPLATEASRQELELAAEYPLLTMEFAARLGDVFRAARQADPDEIEQIGCTTCRRSPYLVVACPTMHWPHWLAHAIGVLVVEMREGTYERLCGDDGDADAQELREFDFWISERLRHMDYLEHIVGAVVESRLGRAQREAFGLRLLDPYALRL